MRGCRQLARPSAIAQKIRTVPMRAGRVTAGKSRAIADGPQMPTATSQKWKRAWLQSQSVGAAQRTRR